MTTAVCSFCSLTKGEVASGPVSPKSAAVQQRQQVEDTLAQRYVQTGLEVSVLLFDELAGHVPLFGVVCMAIGQ